MARYTQPLSPQHTGGSVPSAVSSTTNRKWVSSMTSYPPSVGFDESRGRSGSKGGKEMALSTGSRPERPKLVKKSSSGNSIPRSELSKRPSNSSLASPPLSAYSNFDILSPPTLVRKDTKSHSKVKIKPLLRKISSLEHTTVDLSRSVAENEGLGIFTNSNITSRDAAAPGRRGYHTRTSSGISQMSSTTTSSLQRPTGSQYVHPMRQQPQSYTPPLARSRSRAESPDEALLNSQSPPPTIPQSYAPLPSSKRTPPPPLHVRTYSNTSRVNSSSQLNLTSAASISNNTVPGTPSTLRNHNNQQISPSEPFSPDSMPLTARSSLESAFRKRSRTNTNTATTDDPLAMVQALRAEFYAKEAAKEAKYAEAARRQAEKEARRQEKREAYLLRKEAAAERKRAATYGSYEDEKYDQDEISAVGNGSELGSTNYERTAPRGLPVDEELEWIRKGKRPPPHVRAKRTNTAETTASSTFTKKAKAMSNGWDLFWFRFKTLWLKVKRGVGITSE